MTSGGIIFLSASVPYREGWTADAKAFEIEEAIVSVARAVFARKGRLLFGGHPSVSPLVSAVAGEYFELNPNRDDAARPVITFQSEWFRGQLPDETWELHRFGWTSIRWTPKGETERDSLSMLRQYMLGGSTPPLAMFAVGGMEGVVDEAVRFLERRRQWMQAKPPKVYAYPSGGGAAARLVSETVNWSECSWKHGQPTGAELASLAGARAEGSLVDAEHVWMKESHASRRFEVTPFAAITQWVLDEHLGR